MLRAGVDLGEDLFKIKKGAKLKIEQALYVNALKYERGKTREREPQLRLDDNSSVTTIGQPMYRGFSKYDYPDSPKSLAKELKRQLKI